MMRGVLRVAIANHKGGVGKTTTAISLACLLTRRGRVVVADGDEKTRSALDWAAAGPGLPCEVVSIEQVAGMDLSDVAALIIDTRAGEEADDLLELASTVDLLIIPTKPDALSLRGLMRILEPLQTAGVTNYRVLLTDVPPPPSTDGHEARVTLLDEGVPLFHQPIRRTSAFNKAALLGVPIGTIKGDRYAKLGHMDYELLVRELPA